MKEQRAKPFVKGIISTEMPIVFTATNYMWKLLKIWKLWYPLKGSGSPRHLQEKPGWVLFEILFAMYQRN